MEAMMRECKALSDAWAEAHSDHFCVCYHQGYLHDDGVDACVDCDCKSFRPVDYACKRWGSGPDQCVLAIEHLGPCQLLNGSKPILAYVRAVPGMRG